MNNEHISFCSDEKSLESKNNVNDHSELYFILENFIFYEYISRYLLLESSIPKKRLLASKRINVQDDME